MGARFYGFEISGSIGRGAPFATAVIGSADITITCNLLIHHAQVCGKRLVKIKHVRPCVKTCPVDLLFEVFVGCFLLVPPSVFCVQWKQSQTEGKPVRLVISDLCEMSPTTCLLHLLCTGLEMPPQTVILCFPIGIHPRDSEADHRSRGMRGRKCFENHTSHLILHALR